MKKNEDHLVMADGSTMEYGLHCLNCGGFEPLPKSMPLTGAAAIVGAYQKNFRALHKDCKPSEEAKSNSERLQRLHRCGVML